MKVLLKANNKDVEILESSSTLNENDDFIQKLRVNVEIPLSALEELFVVFESDDKADATHKLPFIKIGEGYTVDIPDNVIKTGGIWNIQLFRRRYSSTNVYYTETASNVFFMSIGEGVKNGSGEKVTFAQIQTMYHAIESFLEDNGQDTGNLNERVAAIVKEQTKGLQPKEDESLKTNSKKVAEAINEVKESIPFVPSWAQGQEKPTYSYTEITDTPFLLQVGETTGTAYDGAKGKKNAAEIEALKSGKQDALAFDGTYNANENKVATVKTVTDKIASILANAPEAFDTLEEIASWINNHPQDVAALNAAIQTNKTGITTNAQAIINALAEAKKYADEKAVGSVVATVEGQNLVLTLKDENGTIIATTTVLLPIESGSAGEKGEKGDKGERGTGILKVSTAPASYTTATAGKNPIKRMSLSSIKKEASVDEVLVGDCVSYSYYMYHIYYVDATYAYMDTYQSIRGATGATGSKGDKGDPGEPGYTPVKGVDYFTEADKEEIVQEVIESTENASDIPAYWKEHLQNKIATVKALQNIGGKDCFSFVLMTDIHYPTNLGKRSPTLAKKIMGDCNIKYTLNCGDMQSRGSLLTKEEILAENKQINEMFSPIKDRLLQVVGNHDGAYYWSGGALNVGTPYVKQLNENEMFEEYIRANGLNGDVHFDKNSLAFYVDDISNKIRYIGLDSMNVPNKPTDVDENGFAKYPKIYVTQFLQAQYDFLCNEALVTVPSDDWCVVVFGHSGIYQAGDYGVMVDVLSAYKDKKPCVSAYEGTPSEVANFTNLFDVNGDGFKDNKTFDNASGTLVEKDFEYTFITNKIPVYFNKTTPCVLRIGGVPEAYRGSLTIVVYDANGKNLSNAINVSQTSDFVLGSDGVYAWDVGKLGGYMSTTNYGASSYVRISSHEETLNTLIVTVDEEITYSEGGGNGYDAVSVNTDFTNAKGNFIAYFHGHDHKDESYIRYSKDGLRNMMDIGTRCDSHQENVDGKDETVEDDELYNERVEGTITEQSFDVFTVNKAKRKIYATKIGAGADREISY